MALRSVACLASTPPPTVRLPRGPVRVAAAAPSGTLPLAHRREFVTDARDKRNFIVIEFLPTVMSVDRAPQFIDLAPEIFRQRLVVEGLPREVVDERAITSYLCDLGQVLDMKVLNRPVTHESEAYGWAGWVHWETSGAHLYAWERPALFVSVDIYTCKPFDNEVAVEFTAERLGLLRTSWRGI